MTVVLTTELARTGVHKFGEAPTFERRWVCTLSSADTPASDCVSACQCFHGSAHPEISYAICVEVVVNEQYEGSRYHHEVLAKYALPQKDEPDPNPLMRPDSWTFESSGAAVPALYYFDGTGNSTMRPLTNSAFDYFEGLTTDEAQQKVTIVGNRAVFPSAIAAAITNCINSDGWLGAPTHSWKCQGIRGELKFELVNGAPIRYWEVTATLLYRQTGWNLQVPDVGFNYLSGGEKKRCWVIDPEDGTTKIPSANPVALDGSGNIRQSGAPEILNRRIYKEVPFAGYFGEPPA